MISHDLKSWQKKTVLGEVSGLFMFLNILFQMSNTHSCLVWSTNIEDAKNLLELEPDNFVDAVNHAFVSFKLFDLYTVVNAFYWKFDVL